MKILWLGNPPFSPSGYGEQASLFIPRLQKAGHELAVMCNHGLNGVTLDWHGLTMYPTDNEWGNRAAPTYARIHDADIILALCDAWVLNPDDWPEGTRMGVWAPVDHDPIPPKVLKVLQHDRITPIAMSRFGEQQMADAGLDPFYVPHGVDTTIFKPQPSLRAQARERLGVPQDAFLAGMVAANQGHPAMSRKAFPQQFDAFARFASQHDDAWLYVHTKAVPRHGEGLSLPDLALDVGMPVDRLRFPPEQAWQVGVGRELMAELYQAFDVLLNASMGEGFGVPILEAQACGVPVIVSDHSAMPEVGKVGWTVGGDRWWNPAANSFFILPSVAALHGALEAAYLARGDTGIAAAAVEHAAQYDADLVAAEHMLPTVEKLVPEPDPMPVASLNRKQRRQLERVK